MTNYHRFRVLTECRLCGSKDLIESLQMHATPLGDRYLKPGEGARNANLIPLEVVNCVRCGNYQTSAVVEATGIYQSYLSRPGAVNKPLAKAYEQYAESLIQLAEIGDGDLVVELGSNDGLFASYFATRKFRAIGVDPAKNLAEISESRGVETISEFFNFELSKVIVRQHGKAKVIVANFMVANIDGLRDFVLGIANLLQPDGVFAMETNYVAEIISNLLIETLNHEHLSYFSVTTLKKFFESLDLQLFDVVRVPSKNGSLRCFVQHRGGSRKVSNSVQNAMDYEKTRGLFAPWAWGAFDSAIRHARVSNQQYCSTFSNEGIVGYGTSIGATILLYQLGLGEFVSKLIDDDPYRQGLESPGLGIPTVGRDEIFRTKPEALHCLILAPQYAEKIVESNQIAQAMGVNFLKIWPFVEKLPQGPWWT